MTATILITGATDGLGLATALNLAARGHHVLLHGRNPDKLAAAKESVCAAAGATGDGAAATFVADLSSLAETERLAASVLEQYTRLDVLINNAGVFKAPPAPTIDGLDPRFAVNAVSPYLLTRRLMPLLGRAGRVVNVSSAAQAPVDPAALSGRASIPDAAAYAQSKLALTMWTNQLAHELGESGPAVFAVNPGSLLATKMVKEGFGISGNDIAIGVDILSRAALDDEFATASGAYYDNDSAQFAPPHPDALDSTKTHAVTEKIRSIVDDALPP